MSAPPVVGSATAFLVDLWGSTLLEDCRVALWRKSDKRSVYLASAAEAEPYEGQPDVYMSAALVPSGLSERARVKAQEARAIPGVWLDIDVNGGPEEKKNAAPDMDAALTLASAELVPTVVIASGYGLHCWWLFDEPWVFGGEAEREQAARISEGWTRLQQARARAAGWRVDSTHDLARLMRLPGTVNGKGDENRPVAVLCGDDGDGPRYAIESIAALALPAMQGSASSAAPSANAPATDAVFPRARFDALAEVESLFRRTFDHTRRDHKVAGWSLSEYDLALASYAVAAGWSDEEIAALLREHRAKHGDDSGKGERADYLARTIARARGEQPPSPAAPARDAESGGTALVEVRNEDGHAERVDARKFAREKLWLPTLDAVIQYGTEEPIYYLALSDGRRIKVGTIAVLRRSAHATLDAIAVALGDAPPTMSAPKWHPIFRALLALRVIEDVGGTPAMETRGWIASFLDGTLKSNSVDLGTDEGSTAAATSDYEAFTSTEGELFLRAEALDKYLRKILKISRGEVSAAALRARLRLVGFDYTRVYSPRVDGERQERRYWRSPPGFDCKTGDE